MLTPCRQHAILLVLEERVKPSRKEEVMTTAKLNLCFEVPDHLLEVLEARVATLSTRGMKLGLGPLTLTQGNQRSLPEQGIHLVEVTITGDTPALAGWTLLAQVAHEADLSIVTPVYGEECPAEHRNRGPVCDHCGHARRRKTCYVLRNTTGEVKTVGSTCLRDFLPGGAEETLLQILDTQNLRTFGDADGWEGISGGVKSYFRTLSVVALSLATARVHGWISKGAAYGSSKVATAERVQTQLRYEAQGEVAPDGVEATPADVEQARKALEWAKTQSGSSYLEAIAQLAQHEICHVRFFGHVASIGPSYQRHLEHQASVTTSKHVGTVGTRLELEVEVIAARSLEFSTLVSFRTPAGEILTWFATGASRDFCSGLKVRIKGTVKKHEIYRGTRQTILSRVKIVS